MRNILLLLLFLSLTITSQAQVFSEDFGTAALCSDVNEANNFTTTAGNTWRVFYTANNSPDTTQKWYISAREAHTGLGNCGSGCQTLSTLTDKTLHISTPSVPGAEYDNDSIAEIFAYTPNIDLTATNGDIKVEFDYLEGGDSTLDNGYLVISVGAVIPNSFINPVYVIDLPKTNQDGCASGRWMHYEYYLPSAFNTQTQVGVGFKWVNNGDGTGTNPSFAVDNILVTESLPLAVIGASASSICLNGTVTFADSSKGNPDTWAWDFGAGATPANSSSAGPINVTFTTAGLHVVTLTVDNNNGSHDTTFTVDVLNCVPPSPGFTVTDNTICMGQCIDFFNSSTDGSFGQGAWTWQFQAGNPNVSALENPDNICYTQAGIYNVTLTVTDTVTGLDSTVIFDSVITVGNCTVPVAAFIANKTVICNNDSIVFTNISTGGPDTLTWEFEGGNPSIIGPDDTSNIDTVVVYYTTPGTYNVKLTVSNSAGDTSTTIIDYITVDTCPVPIPNFTVSDQTICPGTAIVFEDLSQYATGWSWTFIGGQPSSSTDQNPANILYDSAGVYPVTLTAYNVNGDSTLTVAGYIVVDSCLPPAPRFEVERDSICRGTCVQFINTSLRTDSFFWVFWWHPFPDTLDTFWVTNNVGDTTDTLDMATEFFPYTDTIFMEPDPILCFDDSGTIGVQLFAFNEYDVAIENKQDVAVLNIGGAYPKVKAGPDKTVQIDNIESRFYLEDTVVFEGEGTGRYFAWYPQEGLSCYDCPRPIIYPTETRKYYLTNFDDFNCQAYDSVIVFVEESYYAGIPNMFSPNGDNNNDILWLRGNAIASEGFVMRIWNRYGEVVFESYTQNQGWDGTFKGAPAASGTYTYYVKFVFENGTPEELTGSVTLVRY